MQVGDDEAAHRIAQKIGIKDRELATCIQGSLIKGDSSPRGFCPQVNDFLPCRKRTYARTTACGNTTSISVPERPPVRIANFARLASTSALVRDRLTAEGSDALSDGGGVRNGSIAAATSLSLSPWPVERTRRANTP